MAHPINGIEPYTAARPVAASVSQASAYTGDVNWRPASSVDRSTLIAGAWIVHQIYLAKLTGVRSRMSRNGDRAGGPRWRNKPRSRTYATAGSPTLANTAITVRL